MSSQLATGVTAAIAALDRNEPVLIHDGTDREHEVDLLYPATTIEPVDVLRLRRDAGGLIFVAFDHDVATAFDLPFLHEAIDHPSTHFDDVGYDVRPSFSLSVNHRETYTGITDNDRAYTIRALGRAAADPASIQFSHEFRSPGHVHLLRGAPNLLADRRGHTELGLALAKETQHVAAIAGAEMLDDETGTALSPADARSYAKRHGLVYIGADTICETLT